MLNTKFTDTFEKFKLLSPNTFLSTGTTVSDLRRSNRFAKSSDKYLEALARDLQVEDDALRYAIEKGRLEHWWKATVDAVQLREREDADRHGAEAAERATVKMELAENMRLIDGGERLVNGEHPMTNGIETDEQGDIVMG